MNDEPTLVDRLREAAEEWILPEEVDALLRFAADRIEEREAEVRRYEVMEPCGGNCDLAWRRR